MENPRKILETPRKIYENPRKIRNKIGFVAQEVKEVIDRYDLKDGFDMWTEDEVDGRQRIGEAALMPMMVKAVQELSAEVEELKKQLENK